eukprot:1639677-Rhodomonas_salina.12
MHSGTASINRGTASTTSASTTTRSHHDAAGTHGAYTAHLYRCRHWCRYIGASHSTSARPPRNPASCPSLCSYRTISPPAPPIRAVQNTSASPSKMPASPPKAESTSRK